MVDLPSRARVVVVGGGVIGCSVAYHLAEAGCADVLLLERDQLTSGTTWHAAGLMVTFGSLSETSTRMRQHTAELYDRLEAETGQSTGFKRVGFVELASDPDRLVEFRRVAAFDRHLGVDVHEIGPRDVADLFPLADVGDVLAGFYVPADGRANPVDATMALAKGARQRGVRIVQGVAVDGVLRSGDRVTGVRTAHGDVEAEVVVNCTGMWARQLAGADGVNVPLQAAEHYYLITEQVPGIGADWPVIEDPARYGYYREEVGGLMIGLFEPVCAPWHVDGVPGDASFVQLQPDWERMAPYVERAISRVPIAGEIGIRTFFCGPESFTPDLSPVLGEAPELRGYFVAAGLNSIGILTGGGVGRVLAHWILNGRPDVDVTAMNIDRLHVYQSNPEYRRTRTVESLGMVYQCHYPGRSMTTARGARRSPLYSRLAAQGAWFKDVSGWEGADWYAGAGATPDPGPLTWGRPGCWSAWAAEHRACREGVIVMDMSFMSKFHVQGRDAGPALSQLSAGHVDGDAGTITYTQWLNDGGTIEADLTVTKLDDGDFLVVATDTAHRHVETRMRRAFSYSGAHAFATDVTSGLAQLNVQGPRSRSLLQGLTSVDLSNAAFPFRTARWIDIGFARALCVRITYLGELGYELYVPTDQAVHVYDLLVDAGRAFDLRHAGLRALASLRMEKGYRDYGHDIDNTDDPLSAGLGFAVDWSHDFTGRSALEALRAAGPLTRRLVQVQLRDPEPLLHHAEVVRRDGVDVGYVRSASYGHTLGAAVGLAMVGDDAPVTTAWLDAGSWTVDVAGCEIEAVASLSPLYDPRGTRIRM
ncbi:MAG: FAD-dependent oxidoreductase [Ilumatobacteraceae bacterium]